MAAGVSKKLWSIEDIIALVRLMAVCNTPGVRAFEVDFALSLIAVSSWILWRARNGQVGGFYFSGFWTEGKNAPGCAAFLAAGFLLLGLFILLAAILKLDC